LNRQELFSFSLKILFFFKMNFKNFSVKETDVLIFFSPAKRREFQFFFRKNKGGQVEMCVAWLFQEFNL